MEYEEEKCLMHMPTDAIRAAMQAEIKMLNMEISLEAMYVTMNKYFITSKRVLGYAMLAPTVLNKLKQKVQDAASNLGPLELAGHG